MRKWVKLIHQCFIAAFFLFTGSDCYIYIQLYEINFTYFVTGIQLFIIWDISEPVTRSGFEDFQG